MGSTDEKTSITQIAAEAWDELHPCSSDPEKRKRGIAIIQTAIEKALEATIDDGLKRLSESRAAHASEPWTVTVAIIASERQRQIREEGWDATHDDGHTDGALALAAACYAIGAKMDTSEIWPWDADYWKPTPHARIRELAKAGALICAEIDRLKRAAHNATATISTRERGNLG